MKKLLLTLVFVFALFFSNEVRATNNDLIIDDTSYDASFVVSNDLQSVDFDKASIAQEDVIIIVIDDGDTIIIIIIY